MVIDLVVNSIPSVLASWLVEKTGILKYIEMSKEITLSQALWPWMFWYSLGGFGVANDITKD